MRRCRCVIYSRICLILTILPEARLAICTMEQWGRFDGDFDFESFYYIILDLFDGESADPDWTKKTLTWWNQ